MNKKTIFCLKAVVAGILAFALLNMLCLLYYNVPIHKPSQTKSTDYIWPSNQFYSRGTEGFALGVTDINGFNNLKTFEKSEIDVLVMGSSHIEAFNVAQDKNTVVLLNDRSKEAGLDFNFYNIGISGHDLVRCLYNLENAINEFAPQKYIIIETQSVEPSIESLELALQGSLEPIESHNRGIIGALQKFPYLRLVYSQIKNSKAINPTDELKQTEEKENENKQNRARLLDKLLQKNMKICKENDIKLIIFYNCKIDIDEKGNVLEHSNIDSVKSFGQVCKNNDVIFIDMYDDFKDNYIKNYKMPRGFSNTKAGTGHLNEEGHRIISKRIFDEISKLN